MGAERLAGSSYSHSEADDRAKEQDYQRENPRAYRQRGNHITLLVRATPCLTDRGSFFYSDFWREHA